MKITAIPDAIKNQAVKDIIALFVYVISLAFSLLMLVAGSRLIGSMMANNQVSPAMEIPLWWIYLSIPVGGGIMTFRFVVKIIQTVMTFGKEKEGAEA